MAAATKQCPQARPGAPVYTTDHKPLTVLGIRAASTLALNAGETIDMLKIPKGARIIDAKLWGNVAMGSTAGTLGLYRIDTDAAIDADGLIAVIDINGAPYCARHTGAANEIWVGPALEHDAYVRYTVTTNDVTDAADLFCAVTYIMP